MAKHLPLCLIVVLFTFIMGHAQVKSAYLYNTSMPYGVLDIRTSISATDYYYLKEDITFSYRQAAGAPTNTYFDMTPFDSSPYQEGHLRRTTAGSDRFVMNYRLLFPGWPF